MSATQEELYYKPDPAIDLYHDVTQPSSLQGGTTQVNEWYCARPVAAQQFADYLKAKLGLAAVVYDDWPQKNNAFQASRKVAWLMFQGGNDERKMPSGEPAEQNAGQLMQQYNRPTDHRAEDNNMKKWFTP